MDTTRKVSASTITGFLQSEDENETMPRAEGGKSSRKSHQPRQPRHQELYPPPPPPPGYYPYYPPPLPLAPSMSYLYMDLIKHLTMQNEFRSSLPKLEELTNDNKSKVCQSNINNRLQQEVEKKECNSACHKDAPCREYSRLCTSCEQHVRCSCCSKPLTTDRLHAANDHSCPQQNYCQCLLPLHSLMHIRPNQVLPCNCVCQKQEEKKTKRKSKQKSNQSKCHQMCLQSDQNDVPERDNPHPPMTKNRGKTSKRTYRIDDTQESNSSSSDDNCCHEEKKREGYESDSQFVEERRFGFYAGEGDKNKISPRTPKFELNNSRVRKTRRSLAYFINV